MYKQRRLFCDCYRVVRRVVTCTTAHQRCVSIAALDLFISRQKGTTSQFNPGMMMMVLMMVIMMVMMMMMC